MKIYLQTILFLFFFLGNAQLEESYNIDNHYKYDIYFGEKIYYFSSKVEVDTTAMFTITETINCKVKNEKLKGGIIRNLPLKLKIDGLKKKINWEVISVKKNGNEEDYQVKKNNFFTIRIGDENRILNPGNYTYEIKYRVKDLVSFYDDYDEVYWNVNGTDWEIPIDSIYAEIILPESVSIKQKSCNTSYYESTEKECNIYSEKSNSVSFTAKEVKPGETLDIAVDFSPGIIQKPEKTGYTLSSEFILVLLLFTFCIIILYYVIWKKFGKDPPKPEVNYLFDVPNNFSPAELGYLFNKKNKIYIFSSSLVNLAIKKYIKINNEKTYLIKTQYQFLNRLFLRNTIKIEKLKNADDSLPVEEELLLKEFFKKGETEFVIKSFYNLKFKKIYKRFFKIFSNKYDKILNDNKLFYLVFIFAAIIFVTYYYALGFVVKNTEYDSMHDILGLLLFVAIILLTLKTLVFRKFIRVRSRIGLLINLLLHLPLKVSLYLRSIVMIVVFFFLFNSNSEIPVEYGICYAFLIFHFILLISFAELLQRPTEKKLEFLSLIEGFKMYFDDLESNKIKKLNPPELTEQRFEYLMPYAMVLGVGSKWWKHFKKNINSDNKNYQLYWYFSFDGI